MVNGSPTVERREATRLGGLVQERFSQLSRPSEGRNGQCAGAGTVRGQAPLGQALEGSRSGCLRTGRGSQRKYLQGGLHGTLQRGRVRAACLSKEVTHRDQNGATRCRPRRAAVEDRTAGL